MIHHNAQKWSEKRLLGFAVDASMSTEDNTKTRIVVAPRLASHFMLDTSTQECSRLARTYCTCHMLLFLLCPILMHLFGS